MARRRSRQKAARRQSAGFFTFLPWVSTTPAPFTPSRWDGRERALRFYLAFVRLGVWLSFVYGVGATMFAVATVFKQKAEKVAPTKELVEELFVTLSITWICVTVLTFLISLIGDGIELALRAVAASEATAEHTEKMAKNIAWLAQNEYSKSHPSGGGRSAVGGSGIM